MTDSLPLILNKEITRGKEIGEGGFGTVYKGSWNTHEVAIKVLRLKKLNEELLSEFIREATVMAKLNNPAVIRLYGICKEPGKYALVMELMPKGDLYGLLSDLKQMLPWKLRWRLALDIGSGLNHLHKHNIIHRDLKSMNVLLDHGLRAKITDFGLARIRRQSKSIYTKNIKGSIPWMAPELFARRVTITHAADVYAYGMVLWEIAARKLPFSDAHDPGIIPTWIKDGEREDIPDDCPQVYASVIKKCWRGNPESRPTTQEAFDSLKNANNNPSSHTQTTTSSFSKLTVSSQSTKLSNQDHIQTPSSEPRSPSGKAQYQKGYRFFIQSQYQKALLSLKEAANLQHASAYLLLHELYRKKGRIGPKQRRCFVSH